MTAVPSSPQASPRVTPGAPHVRAAQSLEGVMLRVVLALVPCAAFGIYNVGYQETLAIQQAFLFETPGWRGTVLEALGVGNDPASRADILGHGLLHFLPALIVCYGVSWAWQSLFARLRRRAPAAGMMVTALIFTLLLPPGAPLWQVALGISFGIVVGKEVFGGAGFNFVNPALAGMVFLYLSFPQALAEDPVWSGIAGYGGTTAFKAVAAEGLDALAANGIAWSQSFLGLVQGAVGVTSTLACVLGAAVLIVGGCASWRIMAGALLGVVGGSLLATAVAGPAHPILTLPWYWHLTLGTAAFGIVFLAPEPVTAATTGTGRWLYGLLVGGMIVLVRVANPAHPDGVVLAILLGNVFAPLIDYAVAWANIRRRGRRHG